MAGCQKRADSRLLFLQRAVQLVFSMVVVVQLKKAADKVSLEVVATTAGRFSSAGKEGIGVMKSCQPVLKKIFHLHGKSILRNLIMNK